MSEEEPKYYDEFEITTDMNYDWLRQLLIRQNNELRAEVKSVNANYERLSNENESLRDQLKNVNIAKDMLFKLLSDLTLEFDQLHDENKRLAEQVDDLKNRNAKLRQILVDQIKNK
ncbi:MAG: hypothetical protein ABFD00_02285 [Chloroherpetonaceae bacterium]